MRKNKDLLLIPSYDPYAGIIYCETKDYHKYSEVDQRRCFFYDNSEGEYAIQFIESYCSHVHGSLAGSAFILEDWQKSIVRNLFGWKKSGSVNVFRDGEEVELLPRRYGTLFLYIPRKNGKSIFTGALICYVMFCVQEPGNQIFTSAVNAEQSGIIFNVVKKMIQNDNMEQVDCMFDKVKILKESIYLKSDPLTTFVPLTGAVKGKHGLNVNFLACDELHEHSDDKLIEPLITSMGARDEPLISFMTTADYNRASPCNEMHQYAKDVRSGLKPDPSFLPVVYEAEKEDDWTDPKVWAKANPNLGVSVKESFLHKECQKAQNLPSYQNSFKRLYLNIKTDSASVWMPPELWATCDGKIVDINELAGYKCYIGLDLASKQDISACEALFPELNNLVLSKFWLPEEKKAKYEETTWSQEGYITLTPGDVFDTEIAEEYIRELNKTVDIQSIAYDPWGSTQLAMHLVDEGFDMIQFTQTARYFNDPLNTLEEWIIGGKMNHQGNPVLAWMVQNCVVEEDNAEHKKLSKKKSANKIDGVVALAMAIGAMLMDAGEKESVYTESRGILSI